MVAVEAVAQPNGPAVLTNYEPVALDGSPASALRAAEVTICNCGGRECEHRRLVVDLECGQKEQVIEVKQEKAAPQVATKPAPAAKIEFLNGLRGLAALLVVQQHANYMGDINLGAIAVDVFFVLSAFLLTMLFERKTRQLIKQRANVKQWGIMLLDYFSKRFFRVYPLFAATAIALQALSPEDRARYFRLKQPEQYNLADVLAFKFEARYHVFWTLPVEIGYYFLIPVFVVVMVALGRRWWVAALPLYVWIIHEGIYTFRTSHFPLAPHIPTFLSGSLAAFVFGRVDQWIRARRFTFAKWQRFLIRVIEAAVLCLLLSVAFRGLFFHWVLENPVPQDKGFPFVSVPATVVMVIEMVLPSGLSKALEWNVLCYTGKISFSMYLLHSFIIYNPDVSSEKTRYDLFFAQFGLIYLLSTVSYWLVEYPSQLVAQWISRKLTARSRALASDVSSKRTGCMPRDLAVVIQKLRRCRD